MPGFTRSGGWIGTEIEVLELTSTGEGGNEVLQFPIDEETTGIIVVTDGQGRASLEINGEPLVDANSETEFARSARDRLLAYVNEAPRPGEVRLSISYTEGE